MCCLDHDRFGEGAYQAQERTNNWLEAVGRFAGGRRSARRAPKWT